MNKTELKALTQSDIDLLNELCEKLIDYPIDEAFKNAGIVSELIETHKFRKHWDLYSKAMLRLGEFYIKNKFVEKAMLRLEQVVEAADQKGDTKTATRARSNLAITQAQKGFFHQAIETWEELLSTCDDSILRISLLNNISVAQGVIGEYQKGLSASIMALELAEELGNEAEKLSPLINLASIHMKNTNAEKAMAAYSEAHAIAEKFGKVRLAIECLNGISLAYTLLKDLEKALDYANRCLILKLKYCDEEEIAGSYNNIGVINRDNQHYDEALINFEQALSIFDKSETQTNRANSLANIAEIYNHKGDFQKALEYISTAHEIVEQHSLGFQLIRVLRIFRDSYKGAENWEKALEYSELRAQELDRQLTQTHKSTVSITEADYYRAKIEKQAQLYKEQNADLQKSTKLINEKKHQLTLANRELSRSNELLSRIVSVISHDVRTPLANIIQALELINDGLLSPELQEEIFHQLRLSSSDIFDMLDEILSWGKASRGANGGEHDKSSYDLFDLVRSSMEIYHSTARHKGVELEISFPESSITTNADQVFLKITLRNLISNALKFTPKGGKINISLSHKPDGISIVIADSGVGMDKAQLRALMAGKGVTKPGTASEKGFGLGFSFCLDAIERLGAKLKLDSAPGVGTVAEILLPEDKPQSS